MYLRKVTTIGLVLLTVLTIVPLAFAQMGLAVTANDQDVTDGTVTVAKVVSEGGGWIVIHKDEDGSPGAVIALRALRSVRLAGPDLAW